ncbi:hypothetical protein FD967_10625 [Polynucleobacter sp. JS-Mosq-20-D10]|uniref:hypothetical protein n=1 Tax=Polynucleobacter sp. JS-Mosq-20-D10 TaxID=2576922 RepID=UPI001BFD69DE|nr:hypothetical protein [Polynucleobacter sp. JS-Mosq-20-D10]QWE00462.1 hypothetical protein FD967_10625 [Polynucleobacter sp. JS-Mosq-20-D10]
MRINEIANAQEQLELLRLIIDNTWSAVKQQADIQSRQLATKPRTTKPKAPKQAIRIPTPPKPKPLPKPTLTPQQQAKHQQLQQNQLVNQLHTAITKSQSPNSINPKRDTEMGSATPKF